jgi:hypothetical protein
MSSVLREEQQVFDVSWAKNFCTLTDHAISEYEVRIEFDCMPPKLQWKIGRIFLANSQSAY